MLLGGLLLFSWGNMIEEKKVVENDLLLLEILLKNCDVYIGLFGMDFLLVRYVKWMYVELEFYGILCFIVDWFLYFE